MLIRGGKNMLELKKNYQKKQIDFFTDEYYEYVSMLKGYEKAQVNRKESYYTTDNFREKGDSLYECIALEIVHQLHCQLKCEYCYVAQNTKGDEIKPVPADDIIEIINQASEIDQTTGKKLFGQVVFIGGEPTLHPKLPYLIEYALKSGLSPILVTNGVKLANLEYAKKVCLPGVVIVTHLPYLDEQGDVDHDTIVRFPGYSNTLKKAINNILTVKKDLNTFGKDIELVGDFVINAQTIKYAFEVHKYCRMNNITSFFERMRVSDDQRNKYLIPDPNDVKELLMKIYEYDRKNYPHLILPADKVSETEELLKKIEYLITPAFTNACTMTQTGIHIKYNQNGFGEAISCVGQSIPHGNVKRNNLREILKNKVESRIFSEQKEFIAGPCAVCELYHLVGCEGGCRGNANAAFNCGRASDPECLFIKEELRLNQENMAPENCDDCPVREWASCSSYMDKYHKENSNLSKIEI